MTLEEATFALAKAVADFDTKNRAPGRRAKHRTTLQNLHEKHGAPPPPLAGKVLRRFAAWFAARPEIGDRMDVRYLPGREWNVEIRWV